MGEMVTLEHVEKYFSIGGGFLKKNARSVKAVDDVSFTIQEGEIVGLVGESGSGKTTLARALLRLTKLTGGKVCINGIDISNGTDSPGSGGCLSGSGRKLKSASDCRKLNYAADDHPWSSTCQSP